MMPSPGRSATPPRSLHELRKRLLGLDVDGLGVGGGMAERLQDQIGTESEAGQVLELVAFIGPVVSWLPRWRRQVRSSVPGLTPSVPHARPTIFWARV